MITNDNLPFLYAQVTLEAATGGLGFQERVQVIAFAYLTKTHHSFDWMLSFRFQVGSLDTKVYGQHLGNNIQPHYGRKGSGWSNPVKTRFQHEYGG